MTSAVEQRKMGRLSAMDAMRLDSKVPNTVEEVS